jgi:hypothetical protein
LWPSVVIAACKAALRYLQRGDVSELLKESVLAYAAVWAYTLIGFEHTSPYGITPRASAAKIERGIREVAQALSHRSP